MAITAASLVAQVSVSGADKAKSDLEGVGSTVSSVGGFIGNALVGAAVAAGVAIVGFGVKSVQAASNFQDSITLLKTGAGDTQDNMKTIANGVLNLATATGTSTQQLTSGMFQIMSAGYRGQQAFDVLSASAEGAKQQNADLGVVAKAVTTVMHDYASSNYTAVQATNALITTVGDGQMHLQDLSSSLSTVAPLASSLHIPFEQVAGAIAQMTNAGMTAQNASHALANAIRAMNTETSGGAKALTSVGLSATQLHDTLMNKGLPAALELVEDHIGKKWPLTSEAGQSALKAILGGATGLNVALDLGGKNMKSYTDDIAGIGKALSSSGKDIQNWSDVQDSFNFKMQQAQEAIEVLEIKVGTALLPVLSKIVAQVTPVIIAFTDWITKNDVVGKSIDGIKTVISALTPIFTAVGQAIRSIWQTLTQSSVLNEVEKIFQQVGSYLSATFEPVLKQLETTWKTQLLPAFQQLLPALKPIAELVGGILVVAFGLLIGIIVGVVRAFAALLQGAIQISGGIVQAITGMVQIVSGILTFLVDLFTLQWGKIGSDLGTIWTGILNIARGFGNAFMGFFGGLFLAVRGLVGGFIDGVIGYFRTLYNVLVGHSIIPDMVNGIINWLSQLPGRALGAVSSLAGSLRGFFSNLAGQALSWGSDICNNIASGISSSIGAVTSAASNVASAISSILHHSKPEIGPLSHDDEWMPDFMSQLASGINNNLDKVKSASLNVATTISGVSPTASTASVGHSSFASPVTSGGLGGLSVVPTSVSQATTPIQVVVPSSPVYLDGRLVANGVLPHIVNSIRVSTGTRTF